MASTEELIANLSLRAEGLEMMNPEKSKAYAELQHRGAAALGPLIEALPQADSEAAGSIVSLLGQTLDGRAIGPIVGQLDNSSSSVRYEAVAALARFSSADLAAAGAAEPISRRIDDPDRHVRDAARDLSAKLGHAVGWEALAEAFIRLELSEPGPDYKSFAEKIRSCSAAERHGAWIRVAQEAPTKMGRTRAYLEALHNDPDPNSVAWSWLDGRMDPADTVEHVLGPDDPHTLATVDGLRDRLGSIVSKGGLDLPAQKPDPQPAPKPAAEPVAQPEAQPVAEPAAQAAAQPVAEPAAQAVAQPIAAQLPGAAPAWTPTHLVPAGGMWAWASPDPSRPPTVALAERLPLVVEGRAGDWAKVVAVNGWRGWVDGRLLVGLG
jgi:hypothetical protein